MIKTGLKVILAAAALATFVYSWDTNMMQPVLPFWTDRVSGSLGVDPKQAGMFLGMIMGVYALVNSGGNLLFGWMADVKGRRIPITIGFLGCAIALMFYERAVSGTQLIAVRCIHGFFSGALAPCTAAILADIAPPDRRGGFMALWAIFVSVGTAVASPLAGWLMKDYGPGMVWTVMAAGYAVTTLIIWLVIPDTRNLRAGETAEETAKPTAGTAKPRLLSIMGRFNVWSACIGIMALFWVMADLVTVFTKHLTELNAAGILKSDPSFSFGMLMSMYGLAMIVMGGQFGLLSDRIGRKPILIAAFSLLVLVPIVIAQKSMMVVTLGWILTYGFAGALTWSAIMGLMTDELLPHERGAGMGFFMVFPTLAMGIGAPLMGSLRDMAGVSATMWIGAIVPLIALVMVFFAKRRKANQPVSRGLKVATIGGVAGYLVLCAAIGIMAKLFI